MNIKSSPLNQNQDDAKVTANDDNEQAKLNPEDEPQMPSQYLKYYRLKANMTQQALAKAADVYQHHLSEMENNKKPFGELRAKRIASVLGCDYRKLVGNKPFS